MSTIGYATLQVIPSIQNVTGEVGKGLSGMDALGRKAGVTLGEGIASGVESSKARVQKATDQVAKARDKEADAAGKVRVAEAQLNALRDKGITDAGRLAAAEEKQAKAKRDLAATSKSTESAVESLAAAERDLAEASDQAGQAMKGANDSALLSSEGFKKFGLAVGAGVIAAGAGLYKIGEVFDDVADTIRIGTGATGANLDALTDVAKRVGTQVPAEFGAIGQSVADLNTRLGLTGPELEQVSAQVMELANIGDPVDINALSGAMSAFSVESSQTSETLDQLFRVSQATGVPVGKLAETAMKGAPALKQFGFDAAGSAGLIGSLDKAGLDADKMLAAMTRSLGSFSKEAGKPAKEALYGAVQEIGKFTAAGNDAAAIDMAGKLFGTRGAAQFVDAVKQGKFSVDDFVSATGAGSDTIRGAAEETRDFADNWDLLRNRSMAALEPVASRLFGIIGTGMGFIADTAVPALESMANWMGRNEPIMIAVAGVLGALLIPAIINSGTQATIAGAKTVAAWIATGMRAMWSAGVQVAQAALVVASWIAKGVAAAAQGAIVAGAWVATQAKAIWSAAIQVAQGALVIGSWVAQSLAAGLEAAKVVAAWVATQAKAAWSAGIHVAQGALVVGSWIAMGAGAVAQSAVVAAAWVASVARAGVATAATVAYAVAQGTVTAATGLWTAAQWLLNSAFLANPLTWIVVGIMALIAAVVLIATKTTWFQTLWNAVWNGIKTVANVVWTAIKGYFMFWIGLYKKVGEGAMWLWNNAIVPAWNGIKAAFQIAADFIGGVVESIKQFFQGVADKAGQVKDWIVEKWDALVGFFTSLPGRVTSALGSLWDGLKDGFKGALNWIIDAWNNFKIEIKLPSILGGKQITIDTPNLPRLATGGAVRGPGTGTSDDVLMWGSNGEHMWTAREVAAAGGHGGVQQLRAAALAGDLPAYATGGPIGGEPYGLPAGGSSDFPQWVRDLESEYGVTASTYAGHQEGDRNEAGYAPNPEGLNRGIDWGGPVDAMQRFAQFALSAAPDSEGLEQIIWQNPQTGEKIGWAGRSDVSSSGYYASDYGGHQDHVHTRQATAWPTKPAPDVAPTPEAPVAPADPTSPTESPSTTQPARMKSFRELGQDVGGIMADGLAETLGLPSWITDPGNAVGVDDGSNVRTSGTDEPTPTPGITPDPAPVAPAATSTRPDGWEGYSYDITKAAQDLGLPKRAAIIGNGTALVESGDPMKMWANNAVPESLSFPHDAVGSDHDSVGLFQQRDNGAWGTIEERMSPSGSAKLFYNALGNVPGWEQMDMGAAAQAVQRSAFPDRYAAMMPRAEELVDEAALFDTGGVWEPGTWGYNGLREPEMVLRADHWSSVDDQTAAVRDLVSAGRSGNTTNINVQGLTAGDIVAEFARHQWRGAGGYGSRGR
ncbi:phage tail tape measure protein [Gordonia phosphorivorans]|uniref:Phage tail tape measure protein n=1 Tax=Gordonia phosphorivorans TaxID=1056982 RepID=A0ABV6H6H3_9ACTN